MILVDGCDELVGADVGAQIDDFQVCAPHHQCDQILADIVQVALHGSNHCGTDGGFTAGGQQRLNHFHAGVHRLCGQQHVGNEDQTLCKTLADFVDAGHQALIQNDLRIYFLLDCLCNFRFRACDVALNDEFGDFVEN